MTPPPARLAVVGSWHQSSVLCACFAEMGYDVFGIVDESALRDLLAGRAPVYEPGLDELLKRMISSGRLHFTKSFREGVKDCEFVFLAIDTPVGEDDESDLQPVWDAVDELAEVARAGLVVVVTAQVPVGTSEAIAKRIGRGVRVAYVPEFLRLSTALETFREADRFVIGADDPEIATRLSAIYQPLKRPIRVTDIRSAEMGKHACNTWLATSISFINQIADLCEQAGADVGEVSAIMKLDRRIGANAFLTAGLGYAGGTLGREVRALQKLGTSGGVKTDLFDAVEAINQRRIDHILSLLRLWLPELKEAVLTVFGLTYKAGTSTLRRSASLTLIGALAASGARVSAYDPLARLDETRDLPRFTLHREPDAALQGASGLVLMAPWPNQLDPRRAAELMARAVVVDTGNHFDPATARAAGFEYHGVGR